VTAAQNRGSKVLYSGRPTGSLAAVYTVPSNVRAIITKMNAANVSGSASTDLSIHIDATGTTYDDDNSLWHEHQIAQDEDEVYEFRDGLELDAGGSIGAQNHTANGICLIILGYELDLETN